MKESSPLPITNKEDFVMRPIAALAILILLSIVAAACFGGSRATPTADCYGPHQSPSGKMFLGDCTVYDENGEAVSFSDFKGQYLFINFWASWCPYCREEMPSMEKVWQERQVGNFIMLAVSLPWKDETEESAKNFFFNEYGLTYKFAFDRNDSIGHFYDVRRIPTTYLVDANSVVRLVILGPRNWSSANCRRLLDAFISDEELTRGLIRGCR